VENQLPKISDVALTKILKSMGYRSLTNNGANWAKPIGYSLLYYRDGCLSLDSVDNRGEAMTWESASIDLYRTEEEVLKQFFEAESVICNHGVHYRQGIRRFNFLTMAEHVEVYV
jgi:hypothetical protein